MLLVWNQIILWKYSYSLWKLVKESRSIGYLLLRNLKSIGHAQLFLLNILLHLDVLIHVHHLLLENDIIELVKLLEGLLRLENRRQKLLLLIGLIVHYFSFDSLYFTIIITSCWYFKY